jgi:hypothetical protein
MLRSRPERTVGHCSACQRWQYLYQASLFEFPGAVHRHLACVECGAGAWCRDLAIHPEADRCAYGAHKHPVGECVGRL